MTTETLAERSERIWLPLAAPILWSLYFTVSYVAFAVVCDSAGLARGSVQPISLFTLLTAIAATGMVVMFVIGLRDYRAVTVAVPTEDNSPEGRRRFIATMTMLLAALSLAATAYLAIAVAVVGRCV